ncbi:hypothetical protein H4R35_004351 [Dimargaris xerosporica]|nr:hypothetical protein H4R35_004351 [Dimargaris xerosporica]
MAADPARLTASGQFLDDVFPTLSALDGIGRVLDYESDHLRRMESELADASDHQAALFAELKSASQTSSTELSRLDNLYSTLQSAGADSSRPPTPASTASLVTRLTQDTQRLQVLLSLRDYLSVVTQAEALGHQIQAQATQAPQMALAAYRKLCDIAFTLDASRRTIPLDQCSNLTRFLNDRLDHVWEGIRQQLAKKFIGALTDLGWPQPVKIPAAPTLGTKLDRFQRAFADMLLLERPNNAPPDSRLSPPSTSTPVLFAIQVMLRPLIARFFYHFDGDRPTNRLDKPEWMLAHVITAIRDHYPFLEEEVQPVVDQSPWRQSRVKDEFIFGWVEVVCQKLHHDYSLYLEMPLAISHTVQQLAEFDETLGDVYYYQAPRPSRSDISTTAETLDWVGTVDWFLSDTELFDAWLAAERACIFEQYEALISDADAWTLLYNDLLDSNDPHPTQSAEALIQLLDGIAMRIDQLPRVSQQLRFILETQLPLLEAYRDDIDEQVQVLQKSVFSLMKSAASDMAAKAHSSATRSDSNLPARLTAWCRWIHTCLYVSDSLRGLADQPLYLALWTQITSPLHSPHPGSKDTTSVFEGSFVELATQWLTHHYDTGSLGPTVAPSLPAVEDLDQLSNFDTRTVFDTMIADYETLARRIGHAIHRALGQAFTTQLRPYRKLQSWSVDRPDLTRLLSQLSVTTPETTHASSTATGGAVQPDESKVLSGPPSMMTDWLTVLGRSAATDGSGDDGGDDLDNMCEVSPELRTVLPQLNHALILLAQMLPNTVFRTVYRHFAQTVDEFLYYRVILAHAFSAAGGVQLAWDMTQGLWPLASPWLTKPANLYRRTKEALVVLALPPKLPATAANEQDVDTVTADGNASQGNQKHRQQQAMPRYGFHDLCKMLFDASKSRASKLHILDTIGIDFLELEDVQEVLRCRVDFTLDD